MRSVFVGLTVMALTGGLALAQQPGQQPGGPRVGAQPGQPAAQPGQPVQPGQPGQVRQPPGVNQPPRTQPGFAQPGIAQPGQQPQSGNADQQIAAKIYGACHNEVELAKFVQSKLQTDEAKQFAQKMIKDHAPDCETYQKFAGNLAGHERHAGENRGGAGQFNWVHVHQELAQQCLESVKKELSSKESSEIDHCYMAHQAMAHMAMKDCLTVLRNHASPQLAQHIDQSLEGVESHLKEAKQIVKQETDRPSERVSRKPEGNK